ncbi:glycoside hydrolase family 71 protein [Aspergillus saccharolyticus JOP 1030-1]|uniref:Alpha-1,3-glucanase/mutanase n=1 Tax=Aspergillus saccharolyticus JOP 1030-1 TaxID=1450539 RepID=A0A318Z8K1_9EURO|nr:hypothetical protein BP01DRAFT_402592 [Aspergillus saccharolyticus JOP 1030-1]PYH43499.1 hypothetical protein BP01DRAFT_402592 [Aspergillus saccharolyticus JOP 1030-1]
MVTCIDTRFLTSFKEIIRLGFLTKMQVSNTEGYGVPDWESEMTLAIEARIDAFALNIAAEQSVNTGSVANAFLAAENVGFSLFFSFDYAGNGAWAKEDFIELINSYGSSTAYYHYNSQIFVFTFEGPANAADWVEIKEETGCFFAPDWSSLGAMEAMAQADGVADALFSWAAWPNGPANMDTYTDASYLDYLEGKPYMMPGSPWFFTNMPGYDKNWLWRGDDMWFDRWTQALFVDPEFIEIISWNDFGESHYIGPIKSADHSLANQTYTAFDTGLAPYNYALDMPHDGWRAFLPYVIETYKSNISTVTQEGITGWYRLNEAGACASDGGTTGNTVSKLQVEYWPYEIVQDKIFYSALLASEAEVSVSVGAADLGASWTSTPSGNVGIYHGSVSFTGHSGAVTITISRGGTTIATLQGQSISAGCAATSGVENWNAWVGSAMSTDTISVTPAYSLGEQTCVEGWGDGNFLGLCEQACSWEYCPITACVCSKLGPAPTVPEDTGVQGYPIAGEDASYSGLCFFDCNHGYCPSTACGTVEVALTIPTVSDFAPPACTAGEGTGDFVNLCGFGCTHGFCPIHACNRTATGDLDCKCYDECEVGDPWSEDDQLSCIDDDPRAWCEVTSPCDFNLTISTMAELNVQSANMADECIPYYMLDVLYKMIDVVVTNYTDILAHNDYNETLKYYKWYVENNITTSLASAMKWDPAGPGLAYFDCIIEVEGKNGTAAQCPNIAATDGHQSYNIYFEVRNITLFEAWLLADYGIQPDWVRYDGTHDRYNICVGHLNPDCVAWTENFYGVPRKAAQVNITDPRTVVAQALPHLDGLRQNILAAQLQTLVGAWPGFSDDIAVSSMQEVVTIGKEEKAWEHREMIEEILGAIFLVVPFLGELGAVSDTLADVAEIVAVVGDAALIGDSIYEIVEDPDNSVMTILSTLLLTMAAARRDISDETIEALGPVFREKNTQVENMVKDCVAA